LKTATGAKKTKGGKRGGEGRNDFSRGWTCTCSIKSRASPGKALEAKEEPQKRGNMGRDAGKLNVRSSEGSREDQGADTRSTRLSKTPPGRVKGD